MAAPAPVPAPTVPAVPLAMAVAGPTVARHPLPVALQALHSTYAARMRTGVTLLMQPIVNSNATAARPSTRRGGMVNYAEPGSGDEFPDAGALDSDDSDFVASGGIRTAVRQSRTRLGTGMSVFHSGSGMSTPQQTARTEAEQSYLGMVPPPRLIKARAVAGTGQEYP